MKTDSPVIPDLPVAGWCQSPALVNVHNHTWAHLSFEARVARLHRRGLEAILFFKHHEFSKVKKDSCVTSWKEGWAEVAKLLLKRRRYIGNVTIVTIISYSISPAQDKVFFRNLSA